MDTTKEIYSIAEARARHEISAALSAALPPDTDPSLVRIEYPPKQIEGDYVVPCFLLAKFLKQSPPAVATNLANTIKPGGLIQRVVAVGPYLNIFLDPAMFSALTLSEIYKSKDKFGKSKLGVKQRVMVEYFSPNTNKPLTVGHVRNIALGQSISKLMKFCGYKVIQSTLYNNRGIAIAKAMLGYEKWGNNETPKTAGMKPDHFVGSFYVKFSQEANNNPALSAEAQSMLVAWEKGDDKVTKLWQKLMGWVHEGFVQTLTKLGVGSFDEEYLESDFYQSGKEIVEKGIKKGVFIKDKDGVIVAPLEKYGLTDKIVLRPDQTSLYITQDLYLAYLKDKFNLNKSIYVVGSEQDLYLKQLFKILELLGFKNADSYYHLSYGMIRLPSGKIKSREGLIKGTGADELIAELEDMAKAEVLKRTPELSDAEAQTRAEKIARAALKFYILMVGPTTTMVFDPRESLSLTGKTGPYIQYVIARINSIFAKASVRPTSRVDFSLLQTPSELTLVKALSQLPHIISDSVKEYDPSKLANYLYELAKSFSAFYEQVPIVSAGKKERKARLLLIHSVRTVLSNGLGLLGIDVLEKM